MTGGLIGMHSQLQGTSKRIESDHCVMQCELEVVPVDEGIELWTLHRSCTGAAFAEATRHGRGIGGDRKAAVW
jgi:hypothetical protein